jgi:hypothetical protein
MSNQNAWNQGRYDANSGKGPANSSGWSSQQRESYNAGYSHGKR